MSLLDQKLVGNHVTIISVTAENREFIAHIKVFQVTKNCGIAAITLYIAEPMVKKRHPITKKAPSNPATR